MRSPAKPVYEPGMCARRLTHYMYQQQHRPEVRYPHPVYFVSLLGVTVMVTDDAYFSYRTIILSFGENLLLSILYLMPRRSGVFLCMELVGKQLAFFLRSVARIQ